MDLGFKVQIGGVRGRQLRCPDRSANSFPAFRLNFDEKIVESELFQGAGDPEWQTKTSFEYRLREASLEDAMQSLAMRRAVFEVFFVDLNGGRESKVGSCAVDLLSVCTGPNLCNFTLQADDGSAAGQLYFSLVMEQQAPVIIEFQRLEISGLPRAAPYRVSYQFASVVGRDVESAVAAPSPNPQWTGSMLPRLEIRSTLRALLSATLRVFVEDLQQGGSRLVSFDIALRECISTNTNHAVPFKRNAYGTTAPEGHNNAQPNFAALASGVLQFSNLPVFAQFEKGENQQGNIHGKPLLASCPTPKNFTKFPRKLPDLRPGQSQFEVATHAALQPNLLAPPMNTWGAQPPPPQFTPAPPAPVPVLAQPQPTNVSAFYAPQPSAVVQQPVRFQSAPMPPKATFAPSVSFQQHYDAALQHQQVPEPSQQWSTAALQPPMPAYPLYNTSNTSGFQQSTPLSPAPPMFPAQNANVSIGAGSSAVAAGSALAALRSKSPLANAGDQLLRQHQDTVAAVEQQQRRIQALAQELHERTVGEVTASERRMQELEAEEARIRDDLRRYSRTVEDLQQMQQEHAASFSAFSRKIEAERSALIMELEDVTSLGLRVGELAKQFRDHAEEDARIRERARFELESAHSRLTQDTAGLGEVESQIQFRLVQPPPPAFTTLSAAAATLPYNLSSPRKTAVPVRTASPPRYHMDGLRVEPRAISPPRSTGFGALHRTAPSLEQSKEDFGGAVAARSKLGAGPEPSFLPPVSSLSNLSSLPLHTDVEDLVEAVRSNDVYRMQQVLRRSPRAIVEDNSLLHLACANPSPNHEMVATILSLRPELVGGIDTATGATALHFACNAQNISLPVVELLLKKGASPRVLDRDGLNPFHVAVRNTSDIAAGHGLKKMLLYQGGADINGLTGRGETAVHLVCVHDRHLEVLRFLALYGANLNTPANLPDASNKMVSVTPLEKARWYGPAADECRRFLEQHAR